MGRKGDNTTWSDIINRLSLFPLMDGLSKYFTRGKILSLLFAWRNILILLALLFISSLISPHFFTVKNIFNVLRQNSVLALLSLSMTFAMLTGGVDLSVSSILGVCAVLTAGFQPYGTLAVCLISLIAGGFLGLGNGLIISKARIYPFIATLATMTLYRGIALIYTGGQYIMGISASFRVIGAGYVGVVPIPVMVVAFIYVLAVLILKTTAFGRNIYAVGGNVEAARLAGISTDFYKASVYIISGLLAGVAALILVARVTVGEPLAGEGLNLDALAATVMGGTTFAGGVGGVGGTVSGVLILGIINNILNLLNVSPYVQMVFKGTIILAAVFMSEYKSEGGK